jgi:hypothetical protein
MKHIFWSIAYAIFFIILIFLFIKLALVTLLLLLVVLWFRTWQMKQEPNQKEFLQGRVPNPKPDGFYQGSVGLVTSWVGKKFNTANATGINVFKDTKGKQYEKYPFKTYVGPGLFDEKLFVVKIDYNVKGNPFWVRWILDEIVQVAPNEYLGKAHVRIIPGFPFSVLYFELKK